MTQPNIDELQCRALALALDTIDAAAKSMQERSSKQDALSPGGFATAVLAAGPQAEAKCRELLREVPVPRRLPVDDEHCYLCNQTGDMYPVCEDDLDHAACYDAMEMDLKAAAMEVLRLLPRMQAAGVPALIRGKLHVVFVNHLKAYLPKPLAEQYEEELVEMVREKLEQQEKQT